MTRHIAIQELTGAKAHCAHARADCGECDVRLRSVCGALDECEIGELENLARPAAFAAKETLFLEGADAECVFNIVSGVVRLYRVLEDGRRQIIGFPMSGDFIGLDLASKRSFCADAVTTVTACRFPRKEFSEFLTRKPNLLQALHARSSLELKRSRDHLLALGLCSADEKIAWFLTTLRGRASDTSGADIRLPMSRQDIADYLGLTIETVSRTLQRFARENIVEIQPQGVRIVDFNKMGSLAAT